MLLDQVGLLLVGYWLVLTILAPGWALLYFLEARIERPAAHVFAAFSLGTALQPIVAILLDITWGISGATILEASVGMSVVFTLARIVRRRGGSVSIAAIQGAVLGRLSCFVGLLRKPTFVILCGIIFVTLAVNWYSAIDVHSSDMGWHVYWAQTIVDSGRLPNYGQIEPFDQASRFTFGAHYLMASLTLLTGLSVTDIFWVVSVIYGTLTLMGLYVIAVSITHDSLMGLVVAAIVASALLPGGYIERGNLPDTVGYFLVIFTVWIVIGTFSFDWHAPAISLSLLSIMNFHQLAFVIVFVTLGTWIGAMALLRTRELGRIIRANMAGWRQVVVWVATILAGLFVISRTTYLNTGGFNLLVSSSWLQYVPTLGDYLSLIGVPLVLAGAGGLFVAGARRSKSDLVIIAWVVSLLLLSNAPRFGLNFEPYRFMWRMAEPLAIGTVIGIDFFISRLESAWTKRAALEVKG